MLSISNCLSQNLFTNNKCHRKFPVFYVTVHTIYTVSNCTEHLRRSHSNFCKNKFENFFRIFSFFVHPYFSCYYIVHTVEAFKLQNKFFNLRHQTLLKCPKILLYSSEKKYVPFFIITLTKKNSVFNLNVFV